MNKKEEKYPIKYALLPLRVDEKFNDELHCYYIAGYIVSKVLVQEEKKKYNEDGSVHNEYKVIYPHRIQINTFFENAEATAVQVFDEPFSMTTYGLFDTYEKARISREKVNEKFPEIYDYLDVEDDILDRTSDMLTEEEVRRKEISILEKLMGLKEKAKVRVKCK